MTIKKRWAAITVTACLLTTTLFGCGSGGNKGSDATDNSNTGQEQTNEEQTNEGQTTLPGGDISLKLWSAPNDEALIKELTDAFIEKYKNEANITITYEPVIEGECRDNVLGDIANAPDVFAFPDDQIMAFVASGVLEPIENEEAVKSANLETAVQAATIDGKLYAYPMTADNGYILYYNKKYITDKEVETLDGILDAAARNGKKFLMDWSSGWYMYSFFGNTGMDMYLNDDGVTNYCNWNRTDGDINGVDVAEAMINIAKNPGFLNAGDDEFEKGVKDDSIIAGVSGVWLATTIEEAWGDNYGAVKLPTYTCAGKQVQMSSYAGYKYVGVNSYSDNREWAEKLADWLTNEDSQKERFAQRGLGPSNINASESSEVKASPAINAIIEQSQYAKLQRIGGNYWEPMEKFGEIMASGNPDNKNLQEVMDDLVKKITALIGI